MNRLVLSSVCLVPVLLAGCGAGFDASTPELNVSAGVIQGRAIGGQQPIVGAIITAYQVGSSGYGAGATVKATTTTDSSGFFSFPASAYTCTTSNAPMYVVATGGNAGSGTNANIALAAAAGPCSSARTAYLWINEVTTAAFVEALGQFMGTTLGATNGNAGQVGGTCSSCATGTYNRGLVHAMNYTYPQLVNNATGTAVTTHRSGPVTVTTEAAKINTIADILTYCVNSAGTTSATETTSPCGQLFNGVGVRGASVGTNTRASDTLQAALQMQLYPYYNVSTVFGYQSSTPPFTGLSTTPNDWTVALSYTTPNFGLGIAQNTSSNLDIDPNGVIWVPTNATGTAGLAYFDPSAISFGGPYGLFSGIYPQYVAVDNSSATTPVVWFTDLNSSFLTSLSDDGSYTITPYSGSGYTYSGPIAVDSSDNVIFTGSSSSSSSLYVVGTPRSSGISQASSQAGGGTFTPAAPPNGVAPAVSVPYSNGYVYFTDTTSACNLQLSTTPNLNYTESVGNSGCVTGGALATLFGYFAGYGTASSGSSYYICYDNFYYTQGCQQLGNLNNPKAMAADGAGNIWVANAGNASVASYAASAGVRQGDQYGGYTLSTIGTTAYLHGTSNGATMTTPYGIGIDGSGNVWASNAGCVSTSSTRCNAGSKFVLSEIIGVAAPTITPVGAQAGGSFGSRPSN